MTKLDEMNHIRDSWGRCNRCPLHKYRQQQIKSTGSHDPTVLFVLDRHDPEDLRRGQVLQGGQRMVLDVMLSYLKRDPTSFYYTPAVACPTRYLHTIEDAAPLPKTPEVVKCSSRVMQEIRVLQPEVVVAFGQSAVRALFPKQAPQVLTHAGRVVEAMIPGEYVEYPVPVMITNSLHTLGKMPSSEQPELWHQTCQHIETAIRIADKLIIMRGIE